MNNIYEDIEGAQKSAGHELKGMIACFNTGVAKLNYPLVALIDYRGFRLVCLTVLPISASTLVSGSMDGGRTVHALNAEMIEHIDAVCTDLNLRKHYVSPHVRSKGPADLEGHVTPNDQFYLLDFARMMPPAAITAESAKSHFLTRLLRPEFVRNYPSKLPLVTL